MGTPDMDLAIRDVEVAKTALSSTLSELSHAEHYLKELSSQRLTLKLKATVVSLAEYRSILSGIESMEESVTVLKDLVVVCKKTLKKAEEYLKNLQKQSKASKMPAKSTTGRILEFPNDKVRDDTEED